MPRKFQGTKASKAVVNNLLHSVLQAIVDLHNTNGSTEKQIIRQIEAIFIASGKARNKQLCGKIRSALAYGVQQGVIIRRGGKYALAAGVRSCRPLKKAAKKATKAKAISPKKAPVRGRPRASLTKKLQDRKRPVKKVIQAPSDTKRRKAKIIRRTATPGPSRNVRNNNNEQKDGSLPMEPNKDIEEDYQYNREVRGKRSRKSARHIKIEPDDDQNLMLHEPKCEYAHYDDTRCSDPNCICNISGRNNMMSQDEDSQDNNMQ